MYRDLNEEESTASSDKKNQDDSRVDRDSLPPKGHKVNSKELPKLCLNHSTKEGHIHHYQNTNSDTYFSYLWRMARDGDQDALNRLSKLIAPELQRIAQILLSKERQDHTLTTNGLINELYIRLLGSELVTINDRTHFLALASKRMRFILIDYARKRNNQKNNNGQRPDALDENIHNQASAASKNIDNVLDIDKALNELEKIHSGWARVVELRYFGGCQFSEIAEIMDINKRRAERYWTRARTWLFNYLKSSY
ncbi:MAG: sigma-70 family RNA polymerase sigma factor [Rhodothermaceae bacterium]|nr:sigma-70 family RNA polymerase sigma factor [Rhodothermaceae bacterium]